MRIAFAIWDERIAPVFDVARQVCVVDKGSDASYRESRESLAGDLPAQKVSRLAELSVDTLVCGAISRALHEMVSAYGIKVMPFVAGDLQQVIDAWLKGELEETRFAMPGCYRRARRRFRGSPGAGEEYFIMNAGRGGRGEGGGRGRGGRGSGSGRMGGPQAAGPAGHCSCPACGHQEPHRRGIPCAEFKCPKCGTALVRKQ